jgi:hypothetical protein
VSRGWPDLSQKVGTLGVAPSARKPTSEEGQDIMLLLGDLI